QEAEAARREEREAEARGSRADAGQPRTEGRAVKKLVEPASRRVTASYVVQQYAMSERHACRLVGVARSTKRYRTRRQDQETELRQRIRAMSVGRRQFGYRRLGARLEREGKKVNHKRIYRLYRLEGLVVRRRRRKRLARGSGTPL